MHITIVEILEGTTSNYSTRELLRLLYRFMLQLLFVPSNCSVFVVFITFLFFLRTFTAIIVPRRRVFGFIWPFLLGSIFENVVHCVRSRIGFVIKIEKVVGNSYIWWWIAS